MLKRVNAVWGVALLVIITILLAAIIWTHIENIRKDEEGPHEILFQVIDYNIDENDRLNIKIGFINDKQKQKGILRIEMEMLVFENRTIKDKIPMLMESKEILIDEGETIQEFNNLAKVYNTTHSLKIKLMINNKELGTKFLVIDDVAKKE